MNGKGLRPRGPQDRAEHARRRRIMTILVGLGVLVTAVGIALAVRKETCDIETRIPEERALICALRDGGEVPACPSTGMTREECEALLERFDEEHGRG